MCLGKIMGLGLVYSLASTFLGSKAPHVPALDKNRTGRDAVGSFGVSGAVERKTLGKTIFCYQDGRLGLRTIIFRRRPKILFTISLKLNIQ